MINDAENILRIYDTVGRLPISMLNACDVRVNFAPDIVLSEEENDRAFVGRDGQYYLVIGNGHTYLNYVIGRVVTMKGFECNNQLISRFEQCPETKQKGKGNFVAEQIKRIAAEKGADLTLRRKK